MLARVYFRFVFWLVGICIQGVLAKFSPATLYFSSPDSFNYMSDPWKLCMRILDLLINV